MKNIQVKVLNPEAADEAERMMVCAARLTQCGEKVKSLDDFMALYKKPYKETTARTLAEMPHNTIRQFSVINVVVVGASRRFLSQITRRRVGVTFMSASLQYSDYSGDAEFVVPYKILTHGEQAVKDYLAVCRKAMRAYTGGMATGLTNDEAAYMSPQALRNVLLISATPQAWVEMIRQRICRRNTDETRYVMLLTWHKLLGVNRVLFSDCNPGCCLEGKMSCGDCMNATLPMDYIALDYPELARGIL